jgi:hypothetical protein
VPIIEDVEAEALHLARRRAESEGLTAGSWKVAWDGGPILVTALRHAKPLREFKVEPDHPLRLLERDPYTGNWEAVA